MAVKRRTDDMKRFAGEVAEAVRTSSQLAFRHYSAATVHLYRDCPEGKLIGIPRREAVTQQSAVEGLKLCEWCGGHTRTHDTGQAQQDRRYRAAVSG